MILRVSKKSYLPNQAGKCLQAGLSKAGQGIQGMDRAAAFDGQGSGDASM
jgi:hypothetical protein